MQNFAKLLRSKIEARDPAFLKYETGNLLIELIFLFILKMYFLVIQILMLAGARGAQHFHRAPFHQLHQHLVMSLLLIQQYCRFQNQLWPVN